jgi:hypothetical protein
MTTFQPGQLVYAASGAASRYICPVNSAHAVHPIFNFDSDEDESNEELGHPEVLHAVFASPPREKLDAEIEDLKFQIKNARAELSELQKSKRLELTEDRKQALETHTTLAFIADWLLGTELWSVTRAYGTYGVRCVKNGKDGMALHVYRKKTGKPQFVAYDGSGSEREVISIHWTESEANAALRGVLESQLAQYIKADMGVSADLLDLVKQAQRDGVQIPEQIEKVVTAYKATKVREEIEATEKSVSEAKQRIAQLKEKL